jgi:hypothetical protein
MKTIAITTGVVIVRLFLIIGLFAIAYVLLIRAVCLMLKRTSEAYPEVPPCSSSRPANTSTEKS